MQWKMWLFGSVLEHAPAARATIWLIFGYSTCSQIISYLMYAYGAVPTCTILMFTTSLGKILMFRATCMWCQIISYLARAIIWLYAVKNVNMWLFGLELSILMYACVARNWASWCMHVWLKTEHLMYAVKNVNMLGFPVLLSLWAHYLVLEHMPCWLLCELQSFMSCI